MKTLIKNVTIHGGEKTHGWVLFDGQILEVGTEKPAAGDSFDQEIDADGGILSRPMIETHTHGGWGHDAQDGIEAWREIRKQQRKLGIEKSVISLATSSIERTKELVAQAKQFKNEDAGFLGLHLEGPFLSREFKGAHSEALLQLPTDETIDFLIDSESVFSMTLAPELFTDSQLGRLSNSVSLCLGHTSADYDQARAFFGHGNILTHTFNAMNSIHHRSPGPIPAAIEDRNVFLEVIADGIHVADAAIRLLPKSRVILVTDSMAGAGMPDGDYELSGLEVRVIDGAARLKGGELAGSTLTLPQAVKNYFQILGDSFSALDCVTSNPAKAYSIQQEPITVGTKANLILWDDQLNLRTCFNL